jgi:hypothetical protein
LLENCEIGEKEWPNGTEYWVNWATGEKRMSKWNRILSQLSIEQSGKKECPNENSKLSHLSKWWKRNGQMGTVNWDTWANSEKGMAKWEQ